MSTFFYKIINEYSRAIMALLFVFIGITSSAQSDTLIGNPPADTLKSVPSGFSKKWNMEPHSPMKATIYSAVIPGAGQIYNKKWWKSIIVYGGIGTCVYFIQDNTKNYRVYREAYISSVDNDPLTIPKIEGNAPFFNEWQEQYRRWLDVSYMALVGVYVLQIIDANVDAHLFYYDISPDIHLSLHPSLMPAGSIKPGFGLALTF
ncbi:MAG: DUF5683 domain-containing protein [Flavobacteriales bacterium]